MEFSVVAIIGLVVVLIIFFRNSSRGGTMRCNRCDGTGQVNERWPDPAEPSGWHIVEGVCPKCKGKGKI